MFLLKGISLQQYNFIKLVYYEAHSVLSLSCEVVVKKGHTYFSKHATFCITTRHEKVKKVYLVLLTVFLVTLSKQIHIQFQFKFNSCSIPIQKQPPKVFRKKGVLRNFAKLAGKHLCQRLIFDQVAGLRLQALTLLKKSLWYRCFPETFAKFLRISFLIEHLRTTASDHKNVFINEQKKYF